MHLLERDDVLQRLGKLLAGAKDGDGRAVLIRGEAGIGKTSAVRAFIESVEDEAHVLWGGCDDLLTARPFGPIWDMVHDEPSIGEALRGPDRHEVFTVMLDLMARSLRPTVVVIEDIHWADEATLDLIKFLGRRVDRTHGLLVLTYRDGQVPDGRPLRSALADVPSSTLERIVLEPLSVAAVSELAAEAGEAPENLWEMTGGNPFFLTELLAGQRDVVPGSVRDAVMGRVALLTPSGRAVVDLVSVVPRRAELTLVEAVLGPSEGAIAEGEAAGVLQLRDDTISFRHELARRAVEADLPEIKRRELNLSVLVAIEYLGLDISRAAHHARLGGDVDALIRLAPMAARRAADLESHREAVAHLRALEPHLDRLDEGDRADHYVLRAFEEHLGDEFGRAEELIDAGITISRRLGDPARLGNALLVGSRIAWVRNRRPSAVEMANEAASVLESVGGEDLAFAYSTISQLAMLAAEEERAIWYGEKALAVAGEGPSRVRAHALNNMGSARMLAHYPDGLEDVEASYDMAAQLGHSHDQVRAAVNIAWAALYVRDLPVAEKWAARSLDLSIQREMPAFGSYALSTMALIDEMRGRWAEAEAKSCEVIEDPAGYDTASLVSTTLLGRLKARRGEPGAKRRLLTGWERALRADEIQRTGPAAIALAEYSWIGGNLDSTLFPKFREVLADCIERDSPWIGGELAFWLYLIGEVDHLPEIAPEPYQLSVAGDWEAAAAFWQERGIPFDRAVALSLGSNTARIEALAIFDELGAVPVAARVRSELVEGGVGGVPRGPNRATRENAFGLTPRQMDVLGHLAKGLTNAEIADLLFVSTRTVDHHVSAILDKIGASSRAEAVTAAYDAGIWDR
jgi:DNA-binding CsgD family transcriptional regulator